MSLRLWVTKEYAGGGVSEKDKDTPAYNMFDYFISKISGLSNSRFGFNKKKMSLTRLRF